MNDHVANTDNALRRALGRLPRPGLIGIDGRSGAGKTTLARSIAGILDAAGRAPYILEVEEYIGGWDGLTRDITKVAALAADLRDHGQARGRPWDWHGQRWADTVHIPPTGIADVVIITGCGATSRQVRPYLDLTIWVEAPAAIRRERVGERDSYDWSEHWEGWARQEDELLNHYPAHLRADIIWEA